MASTDARPIPRKNVAYRVTFPIMDADGDLVTGAAGLDSEVSKDQGTFADCTNEATEIATSSGMYFLDLTATEMDADTVAIIVKTSTVGAKTTAIVLYPEEIGDVRVNVEQFGGTNGTFSAGRPEVNTTHAAGTAWGSGAITAASIAADAITDAKVASDVTIASVTGAVGSVTGAVGSVTGNVGGNVVGTVASVVGAVGSVTGNVGGNVTGSVGSIASGGITTASFAAGAINAAAIAGDAITDAKVAADVTIASVTGAVGSVTGNIGGNVVGTVASVTGSVGSVTGAVGSVTGAVGSVTGNVGGNVVGSVASVTAGVTVTTNNDKTGYRLSATGVDDVLDEVVEGSTTLRESMRLANAANGAKTDGAATTTFHARDLADSKNRVTATVDADGNRTTVTRDLT